MRWRTSTRSAGGALTTTRVPLKLRARSRTGTSANGIDELRQVLLQRPDAFRTTITEKLLAYAAAESVVPSNGTLVSLIRARQILHSAQSPRWSELIAAIVKTKPIALE